MFDIGFSELFIIGIVALVVIGPERLPKVARTAGHLFGRLQRYVSQVKSDISREMELAELSKAKNEFESAARTFQSELETKAQEAERGLRDVQQSVEGDFAVSPPADPAAAAPEAREPAPASPQLELGIDDPASRRAPPGSG